MSAGSAGGGGSAGAGASTRVEGPACVDKGDGGVEWVPISDEARLVLFFGGAERAKFNWALKAVFDIAEGRRSIAAEAARAVVVKSWTGKKRTSSRYGRDLVQAPTPLRTFLDCTDVLLVVAAYLGASAWEDEGVKACLCLGAYGGHRGMVEVASSMLYGTVGVVQRRLALQCADRGLAWWAGAGGEGALFRDVVWGHRGGTATSVGPEAAEENASPSRTCAPDVFLSAVGGAAYGGLLEECRRGLEMLRGGGDGSDESWKMGVAEALVGGAGGGRVDVVEWALGQLELVGGLGGMDVNVKDGQGRTALQVAAERGHAAVVEKLVSLVGDRLDVNAKDRNGRTALLLAAGRGHADMVERLQSSFGDRLDINAKEESQRTALHRAAMIGHLSVVEVLVSVCGDRLDVNAKDWYGSTALLCAAEYGHASVVEEIVSLCGARLDVNCVNDKGWTALQRAAAKGHAPVVEVLVSLLGDRLDVRPDDRWSRTALHWAAENGRTAVVEELVSLLGDRLDVNAKEREGRTALHLAANEGFAETVEALVSVCGDRLDVNAKDGLGRTALHRAAAKGHASVVEVLVSLCRDRLSIHVQDWGGKTALDLAAMNGYAPDVERWLG